MNEEFKTILQNIEKSLQKALPSGTNEEWQFRTFRNISDSVTDQHLANLIKPCRNLMDLGGKRWRPLLLILTSELCRESGKKSPLSMQQTYDITPLVEFVHTASLIHDDIEDSADTRRGKPAAHITYGLDTALNAGSWLYFQAPVVIDSLDASTEFKNQLYALYTQELRRLHLGQAMDIYWHRNPHLFPSAQEYTQMVHCKTGTLASLAVQTGFLAGGATPEEALKAGTIAAFLGEGFQILDDVQNLTTGNPGKKRGDDIVEGKKSLPVLLHISENPQDKEKISELFKKAGSEGIDSPAVEECIGILESKGAVQKALEKGKSTIIENINALVIFFGSAEKSKSAKMIIELFDSMSQFKKPDSK